MSTRLLGVPTTAAEFAAVNNTIHYGIPFGTSAQDENGLFYLYVTTEIHATDAGSEIAVVGDLMYATKNDPLRATNDYSEVNPEIVLGVVVATSVGASLAVDGTTPAIDYGIWILDISKPNIMTVNADSGTTIASGFPVIVSSVDGEVKDAAAASSLVAKRVGMSYSAKVSGTTSIVMQTPFGGL